MLMQATRTTNLQNTLLCCIVLTFECYIQHSNIATFEGLFECRTFVYALVSMLKPWGEFYEVAGMMHII